MAEPSATTTLVPRWTPVIERIPDEKRRRVLESAMSAFARNGFAGTNVNHIPLRWASYGPRRLVEGSVARLVTSVKSLEHLKAVRE